MKTVTFCGHRDITSEEIFRIKDILYLKIEELIKNGAEIFLLGGYGNFDTLCGRVVKELKEVYPYITSVFVTPYVDRDYNNELYDYSEYPPIENIPKRYAILKRNEYMVEKSDVLIAYVKYEFGGAAKTLEYAKKKQKSIVYI